MAKGLAGTPLINDPNLVSLYKLENTSDSKGSNTLTNNNAVVFSQARFDNGGNQGSNNAAGSNKYFSVAGNLGIAGNSDLSVSLWIKQNSEVEAGHDTLVVWSHRSQLTSTRYIQFNYLYNSGTPEFLIDVSGTAFTYVITLGTANYYNIVLTRNVSGNSCKLYVNASNVASGTLGSSSDPQDKFTIGSDPSGAQSTSMLFDDVSIFNRVLTQSDVNTIFASPTIDAGGSFLNNFL